MTRCEQLCCCSTLEGRTVVLLYHSGGVELLCCCSNLEGRTVVLLYHSGG